MIDSSRLTNLQIDLLKMFSYDLSNTQLREINDILCNYFADKAVNEIDKFIESNGISSNDLEVWANEHLRAD